MVIKAIPWKIYPLDLVVLFSKEILQYSKGKEKKEIERFLEEFESTKTSADKYTDEVLEDQIKLPDDDAKLNIEEWRKNIPEIVKNLVDDWRTIPIDELLMEVGYLIDQYKGVAKALFEDYYGEIEDLKKCIR